MTREWDSWTNAKMNHVQVKLVQENGAQVKKTQMRASFCHWKCRKLSAIVMIMAVVLMLLFSTVYLVEEADHDCVGENCPVCDCLAWCGNFVRRLSDITVSQVMCLLLIVCGLMTSAELADGISMPTLITWKVRLNP
ncbi:MAG: hypothetical protein IJ794_14335 [Lachnospiraceae bacterium]|nr:hypothetical protein [Lachnospiraceae bacterium]